MDGRQTSSIQKSAQAIYNKIDELKKSDSWLSEPAPEPWFSFWIGGILLVVGVLMWMHRVQYLVQKYANKGIKINGSTFLRAMISCATDSDSEKFVIVTYSAISFLLLGGFQWEYQPTWWAMIAYYFVASSGDSIRVLLAFWNARSLDDVVIVSSVMQSNLKSNNNKNASKTQLNPSNVYQDLGRDTTIVFMVFITQVILISFVCYDLYRDHEIKSLYQTSKSPVVRTMGSWLLYVFGIFLACVYLVGPKTKFGQSEQNPAYWLQLLLAAKQKGVRVSWYDPIEDKTMERALSVSDWEIWSRFFMSYLINGVGFHVLVHALPIQVAGQANLMGVVGRHVGMMTVVGLDDTHGFKLTIVKGSPPEAEQDNPSNLSETASKTKSGGLRGAGDTAQFELEAQKIIEEAKAKLEALSQIKKPNKRD